MTHKELTKVMYFRNIWSPHTSTISAFGIQNKIPLPLRLWLCVFVCVCVCVCVGGRGDVCMWEDLCVCAWVCVHVRTRVCVAHIERSVMLCHYGNQEMSSPRRRKSLTYAGAEIISLNDFPFNQDLVLWSINSLLFVVEKRHGNAFYDRWPPKIPFYLPKLFIQKMAKKKRWQKR